MPSNFDWRSWTAKDRPRGPRFWLQVVVGLLGALNAVALFFYLAPPGGTRTQLTAESQQLASAITAARMQTQRLKRVSTNVQLGSEQATSFGAHYIFPKRLAYESIIAEIQRMSLAANLTERDGAMTEEPIEGTDDLSVLTNQVNFEGTYPSLVKFLYEVDRSPKMLMLDTLTATPQRAGLITAQARFQAVIREEPAPAAAKP